ncbi:MAG TPA: hypothetical protein VE782_03965 [Myxococcaceae bacterium]|nr:hypothetical protein [Myxococcaceae bacterium]
MIAGAAALMAASILLEATHGADAPLATKRPPPNPAAIPLPQTARAESSSLEPGPPRVMTLKDAPTTPGQSFGASVLTSFTGMVILGGIGLGPTRGLPMSDFSVQARIATGLFLLSVGPSVGDLMNHDTGGFLAGAGGRTLLTALGWGAVSLARVDRAPILTASSTLFVTLGALVWIGWGATDLVRSLLAPERWVDRQNRTRRSSGVADPTRGSAGGVRSF